MHTFLLQVKSYNQELTQHVELLTGRLDQQHYAVAQKDCGVTSPSDNDQDAYSSDAEHSEQMGLNEILNLKETVSCPIYGFVFHLSLKILI